jgi:hypothetical protein
MKQKMWMQRIEIILQTWADSLKLENTACRWDMQWNWLKCSIWKEHAEWTIVGTIEQKNDAVVMSEFMWVEIENER